MQFTEPVSEMSEKLHEPDTALGVRSMLHDSLKESLNELALAGSPADLQALELIIRERTRQIRDEGWIPEHDDVTRKDGALAAAAASYCIAVSQKAKILLQTGNTDIKPSAAHPSWPFHLHAWRPASQRRMAVKASALILAELSREIRAEIP